MGAVLNSVMEDVVKSFAGQSFKKQTILNAMKNRGVKDAELEASGMKKFIQEYKGEKVPVEELNKVIQSRTDKLTTKAAESTTAYNPKAAYSHIRERNFMTALQRKNVTMAWFRATDARPALRNKIIENMDILKKDPTNKESREFLKSQLDNSTGGNLVATPDERLDSFVAKWGSLDGEYTAQVYTKGGPHNISNHFDVPNYYSHVRYTDVAEGNRNTRYVHELQSDVHQGAKDVKALSDEDRFAAQEMADGIFEKHVRKWHEDATGEDLMTSDWENYHILQDMLSSGKTDYTVSDLEDAMNWVTAQDKDQLARNQAMVNDINAASKSIKDFSKTMNFTQDENYLKNTLNKLLVDTANEGKQSLKVRIAPDEGLARSDGVQQWYEKDVVNTIQKQAKKIGAKVEMTPDGYAQIDLPETDFKLPMYSTAGMTMIGATAANKEALAALPVKIKQAKDAGYNDDEVKQYLAPKYDANVIDRAFQLGQPQEGVQ